VNSTYIKMHGGTIKKNLRECFRLGTE